MTPDSVCLNQTPEDLRGFLDAQLFLEEKFNANQMNHKCMVSLTKTLTVLTKISDTKLNVLTSN